MTRFPFLEAWRVPPGIGRALALFAALALAGACSPTPDPPAPAPVLEAGDPDPARVEALVILVGDAGTAFPGRSPLLAAVGHDVEAWAPKLPVGRTSVAYLGDLVYPWGVRAPGHPDHPVDTLHLHAQLEPILGPLARRNRAGGWFLDGNHDWGHLSGEAALDRLRNAAAVVRRWADGGHRVRLAPSPGSLAPEVVDIGEEHRIVFVSTHAWLVARPEARRRAAEALGEAVTPPGRAVTVLSHHPLQTAGEHGADPPRETGLGFQYLASKAGLIRQDLSSRAYRDMVRDAAAAMAPRPPLVWAGGHDHTLQLLRSSGPGMPLWTVVSGSASKVGRLGRTPELIAGGPWPGYARLFLMDDGTAHLQVVAAPQAAQHCIDVAADELPACMEAGLRSYRTVISRLLQPH